MRAVNLIPAEQRRGGTVGARSQGAAFAVLALLAGVVLLTVLYGKADHQLESRQAEAASLTTRAQAVKAQAAKFSAYSSFMQMREQRLQEMAQLINSRFDWSSSMGELSRVIPSTVVLNTLQATAGTGKSSSPSSSSSSSSGSAASSAAPASSATTRGATPNAASVSSSTPSGVTSSAASVSSATPPGVTPTFTLSGCAATQTAVAQMLLRLRLMSGVSNVTLQSSTKPGSGGAAGGSGGGGSCAPNAPSFTASVTFQPLPAPPVTSTQAIESTVAQQGGSTPHERTVSNTGGSRK